MHSIYKHSYIYTQVKIHNSPWNICARNKLSSASLNKYMNKLFQHVVIKSSLKKSKVCNCTLKYTVKPVLRYPLWPYNTGDLLKEVQFR